MQSSRFARIGAALAAVVPPTAVGASVWEVVRRHPVAFAGAVLAYELVLVAAGLALRVLAKLEQRWVDRAVEAVDAWSRRLVSRYERSYRRYLAAVHHDVDVKGLTTRGSFALSLDEVFVDLSLMHQTPHQASGDILSGDPPTADTTVESTRQQIWQMLARGDHPLVILGAPGSGKTTLLKHMTVALCRGGRAARRQGLKAGSLPVLLFLREHVARLAKDPDATLASVARDTLKNVAATEPPEWLGRQLRSGRCVVLFDGLDEVARPEDRRLVVDWVERQIAAYRGNRFVLTSRPYGYRAYPLNSADVAQVRPFTERQAKTFVDRWYHATHARATDREDIGVRETATRMADDLMARLNTHHALHALSVNPLLLTMVAHVHYYRGALPGSRAGLYREICQVLLGRRQEAKGLGGGGLTPDQKELVLRVLAHSMMEGRARDVTREQASLAIGHALASVKRGVTPEDFLVSIEQECGLLVERENGLYSFPHLTLQEYLAAAYISERGLGDSLAKRVSDDWWRETTLLYVAQADASAIVRACLEEQPSNEYALELAADCAEEAREIEPSLREELEEMLSINAIDLPPDRLTLNARVMVARKMRRAVRVGEDGWFCQAPVTRAEYALFLAHTRDTEVARRYLAHEHGGDVTAPARGLRSTEVIAFVRWCQQFDPSVSLPRSELMRRIPEAVFDPDGRCAWILPDGSGPRDVDLSECPILHRFGRPLLVPDLESRVLGAVDAYLRWRAGGPEAKAEILRALFSPPDGISEIVRRELVLGPPVRRADDGAYSLDTTLIGYVTSADNLVESGFMSGYANTADIDAIPLLVRAPIVRVDPDRIPDEAASAVAFRVKDLRARIKDLDGDLGVWALPSVRMSTIMAIGAFMRVEPLPGDPLSGVPAWRRQFPLYRRGGRHYARESDGLRYLRAALFETVKLEMRAAGELSPTEVLHLVRS